MQENGRFWGNTL